MQEVLWVNAGPVEPGAPMQMRSGGAPGTPDTGDGLALVHVLALPHEALLQVEVHGVQAVAVVQNDRRPREEVVRHQHHDAGIGGKDWRSRSC